MEYLQKNIKDLEKKANLRRFPLAKNIGKYVELNAKKMLNLASNDYLGLALNSELKSKFLREIDIEKISFSYSSSRLLGGFFNEYEELEKLMADLFNSEASLVVNSGYHANLGILPAISDSKTLIIADKLVHASIIDGIILSRSDFVRYIHNDYEHLEKIILKNYANYNRIILVTESIFSMDGDESNLKKLVELKEKYKKILLYVDEAHAIGVVGNKGLGLAEKENCIEKIDFLVGTFGKAIASVGAYIICNKLVKENLINKMRPLIFSTALPPLNIAWTRFIMENINNFSKEREHLQKISEKLRLSIKQKYSQTMSFSHIIPLVFGESRTSLEKAEILCENGFYALPVRPPAVPAGSSRIRFSLNASITDDEISRLSQVISDIL